MTASAAINSAGANMLSALIKQIEQLQKPWQQMPEREQQVVIFHLRESVEAATKQLVKAIAGGNHPSIPANVDSITFKDGVKVSLKLAGTEGLHSLIDAKGGVVQIVLASVDQYIDGIEQIRASADQAELFESHESDDETSSTIDENQNAVSNGETAPDESGVPKFVFGLLASVGVLVPLETVQGWTKEQLTVATDWASEYANTPPGEMCAIARPHWLPMPEPKDENTSTHELGEHIELRGEELEMAEGEELDDDEKDAA